jgi:hypothetical protein
MANEEAPLPEVVATERRRADRRAHADRRRRDIPVARERRGGQGGTVVTVYAWARSS